MMRSIFFVAAAVAATASAGAEAQSWRGYTQICDKTAESTFCVGKAGCPNWEWLTKCTARNAYPVTPESEARLQWCIDKTYNARARPRQVGADVGDPVFDTMKCFLGQI